LLATTLSKPIRVLIADDHRLFAQALEAILATDPRIEVAGHARDGREAVELARELRPDVILMDIAMPVMDGFQATREIRKEQTRACILMLTGSNSRTDVDRARKAGAAGYVTKDRIAAELIDAIVEVVSRDEQSASG
jgi:DNA-binding NarL/FixJ family response regulator